MAEGGKRASLKRPKIVQVIRSTTFDIAENHHGPRAAARSNESVRRH